MRAINEYLSTKVNKSKIVCTDNNLRNVILEEIKRIGINGDFNHLDVSNVKDFCSTFNIFGNIAIDFNGDISKWNVSKGVTFSYMFYRCKKFNCDISDWDMSNAKYCIAMFDGCESFNQDIGKWNLKNAERMHGMFRLCKSFDCDLSSWELPNLKSADYIFDNTKMRIEHIPEKLKKYFE